MLTQQRLKELLHYDPESGEFIYRTARGIFSAGTVAGCLDDRGYTVIGIDYKLHRAGRLAWLYMTGAWPDNEIDHKDGCRSNDRFKNLRPATQVQNKFNTKRVASTGRCPGVYWRESRQRWVVRFSVGRVKKFHGYFDNLLDAAACAISTRARVHGQFAIERRTA